MDKYDAALAKARAEYEKARKQGYTWLMNLLEGMFPEMKESEDEKIRKWLIEEIKATHDYDSPTSKKCVDDALAWLEKQKENPDRVILIGKAKSEKQVVLLAESNGDENIYWDTKSEEDAVSLLEKGLKFFGKQNPAEWSKEDEEMRINILQEIANIKDVFPKINIQPEFDWLKSLPERFNLQPKQEWSEKDELMRGTCIYLLEHDEVIGPWKNCIAWLKSLKNRGNPPKSNTNSPSWKPSEEQMGMLLAVINDPNNAGAESCHLMLQSLFADLQKLLSHEIH